MIAHRVWAVELAVGGFELRGGLFTLLGHGAGFLGAFHIVVFPDRTLAEIADRSPRPLAGLARIPGAAPPSLDRYGAETLAPLAGSSRPMPG